MSLPPALVLLLIEVFLQFLKQLALQIPGIQLRIHQLELETAQPERREAARARKKLTKEVQRNLSDSGKTDTDKIKYLEGVFSHQASCYTACTWIVLYG